MLRVPAQQIANIRRLLEVPDELVANFISALKKAGPKFNVYDLAETVSQSSTTPPDLTLGVIQILASLYLTKERDYSATPIDKFVDNEVFQALRLAQTFSADKIDIQWEKLRNLLIEGLSLERTLGTTAKAGPVLTQHERILVAARIMTDLRPVYHLDVSEKPDAALIIHMLKLTQRDNFGKHEDLYFALDSNDLIGLRSTIERAMEKEKTLRTIVEGSSVMVLTPKTRY